MAIDFRTSTELGFRNMRNTIDIKTLSSEEFAMYNTSKLKLRALFDRYEMLSQFPPFAWNKDGTKSSLRGEFMQDLRDAIADVDEEDFITDRYTPIPELTKKYKSQIDEASQIMSYDKHVGKALKKWFEDNGITMDESVAYGYGV